MLLVYKVNVHCLTSSNVTYREMLVENITLANLVIVLLICLSFPIQILSVH